jgi:predicted flap endonuclease-1-like 5' DNA nuclease
VIEGIGPKIAELLRDAGFTTWLRLSEADPTDLRRVLDDAGSRFRVHDPANWPPQAGLLAHGRWQEFKDLVASMRKRRAS